MVTSLYTLNIKKKPSYIYIYIDITNPKEKKIMLTVKLHIHFFICHLGMKQMSPGICPCDTHVPFPEYALSKKLIVKSH